MQKGIVVTVPVLVLTASFSAVIFLILSSSLSSCSCPSSITFQNDAVFAVNDGDVMLSEKISTSREDIDWVIDLIRSNGLHMQDNVLRKGINPRTREQQLQDMIQ